MSYEGTLCHLAPWACLACTFVYEEEDTCVAYEDTCVPSCAVVSCLSLFQARTGCAQSTPSPARARTHTHTHKSHTHTQITHKARHSPVSEE